MEALQAESRRKAKSAFLADYYSHSEPIAVCGISNFFGIAVFKINHEDESIINAFHNGEKYSNFAESPIKFPLPEEERQECYFVRFGERYYLGDFINTDIGR